MDVNFPGGNFTEVTVDSGAEESVRPCNWREQFGLHKAPKVLGKCQRGCDSALCSAGGEVEALF